MSSGDQDATFNVAGCENIATGAMCEATIAVQRNDGQRLSDAIGFRPEFTLREGLERTASFYREFLRRG